MGLVEEYGEGIDRMYREMESCLMEPPAFEATASSVTITLRNRFLGDVEYQVWLMRARKRLAIMRGRVCGGNSRKGPGDPRHRPDRRPGRLELPKPTLTLDGGGVTSSNSDATRAPVCCIR